jgi:dipeptidyl aminopeptidase/acylaminoacyl peptidase
MIHGGPHGSWTDAWSYRWNPLLFAAPGYVVACVNFHGSMGSGQKFADAIVGAHGDKPLHGHHECDRHTLIDRGIVDPDRMAAAGGSYGGYLTAWISGTRTRFKALVVHAGVYDLMGQFASDAAYGRSNNYRRRAVGRPGADRRYSPSRFAAEFQDADARHPRREGLPRSLLARA